MTMPTIEQIVIADKQSCFNFPRPKRFVMLNLIASLPHYFILKTLTVMSATLTYYHYISGVNINKRILKTYMYGFAVAYQDE